MCNNTVVNVNLKFYMDIIILLLKYFLEAIVILVQVYCHESTKTQKRHQIHISLLLEMLCGA